MIQNEWLRVQLTAIDSMSLAYWCGVEWLSIYYWFFAIFATWLTDEIQQLEIINPPNGSSVYHIRIYGLLKEMAGNSRWTGDIFFSSSSVKNDRLPVTLLPSTCPIPRV